MTRMTQHSWNLSPREAVALQRDLASAVRLEPFPGDPRLVGGCDVSMNRFAAHGFAGFVTLSFPSLEPVDHAVVEGAIPFPYVPGLLSFREIPMLLPAWERLGTKPDLILVDGIGVAHPRRLGIASHVGVLLDLPTIGCAKSVLTGTYEEPGIEAGSWSPLVDTKTGERIGTALRTKRGVKPMFVSPGHRVTHDDAVRIVLACVRKHRLPEPTRAAHDTVNAYRIARKELPPPASS